MASKRDSKLCKQCGNEFFRWVSANGPDVERPSRFAKRKFCSVACNGKANGGRRIVPTLPKRCLCCSAQIFRVASESQGRFARRKYCSVRCRNIVMSPLSIAARAAKRVAAVLA